VRIRLRVGEIVGESGNHDQGEREKHFGAAREWVKQHS
jgi:hypothetical protein